MEQHYYNFTFIDGSTGTVLTGNCYLGLPEQRVTLAIIELARKRAKVTEHAVLTDCSYLGYMTKDQFHAPL